MKNNQQQLALSFLDEIKTPTEKKPKTPKSRKVTSTERKIAPKTLSAREKKLKTESDFEKQKIIKLSRGIRNSERRELNKELKKEYEFYKQIVLKYERDNYGYIVFLRTQDYWYKVMAHSAIILSCYLTREIAGKHRISIKIPEIKPDSDFRYPAPIGVISLPRADLVMQALEKVGLKREKVELINKLQRDGGDALNEGDTPWIAIYKMPRRLSMQDFWELKNEEEEAWGKVNQIILPEMVFPDLAVEVQDNVRLFYDIVRKMDAAAKELIGKRILFILSRMQSEILQAEKSFLPWDKAFYDLKIMTSDLESAVMTIRTSRLTDRNVVVRMAEKTIKIEEELCKAEKRYLKSKNKVGAS